MSRPIRILALAGLAWALWELLRRVRDEQAAAPAGSGEPAGTSGGESGAPSQAPASRLSGAEEASRGPEAVGSPNGTGSGTGASKAELYERAQRLGIKGRSKMTKAELERAIREVR